MNFRQIFSLFMLFTACKPSVEKKPDHLISKGKMVEILAEIHHIEGIVNGLAIQNTDTSSFLYRKLEADLFKKMDVDTAAYFESYKYYLINADEFTDIYKQVVEKVKQKNRVDSLADAKLPKSKIDTSAAKPGTQSPMINRPKSAFLDSLKNKFKHAKK
jgi:Domain of unknown function (DUF4296)